MDKRIFRVFLIVFSVSLMTLTPALSKAASTFTPVVGVWKTDRSSGEETLKVDGSQHNFSYEDNYPLASYSGVKDFSEGEISVRFNPLSGNSDQSGGIVFNRKENGDYLVIRANALESNFNLYSYTSGHRVQITGVDDAPARSGLWHEIKIIVKGPSLKGYLDGALLLEYTLAQPVSGGLGIWSRGDSVTLFKEFKVANNKP